MQYNMSLRALHIHCVQCLLPMLGNGRSVGAELTSLDTSTVEAEWLHELLMDLPVVENPIPASQD